MNQLRSTEVTTTLSPPILCTDILYPSKYVQRCLTARHEPLPEAGAQRTLEAVGSGPWLGPYVRAGGLRPLREIRRHQTWPKCEHVGIVRVHCDMDPVVVGRTERLDAREVFERRSDRDAPHRPRTQGLVHPEEVAIAVDQHHRLAERGGLLLQLPAEVGIAARILRRARKWRELRKHVRLLHDHDCATVVGLGVLESVPQPGKVGLVAL